MSQHSHGYFKLTKNDEVQNGQPYHFTLNAPNNEVILTSENYTSSNGARNGIDSVRVNGVDESRFEMKTSKIDEPYFVLKAANGEIIGTSEMYSSKGACKHGISAVMKYASIAALVDTTVSSSDNGEQGPITTPHPTRSKSNKYA